jgi:hypothetical protein
MGSGSVRATSTSASTAPGPSARNASGETAPWIAPRYACTCSRTSAGEAAAGAGATSPAGCGAGSVTAKARTRGANTIGITYRTAGLSRITWP